MKDLKKIKGTTAELTRLQSNLDNWAQTMQKTGIVNGVLLQDISLVSSTINTVEHKLGRTPLGYIVVTKNANANIWNEVSTFTSKFLMLQCSSDVTISLWVF